MLTFHVRRKATQQTLVKSSPHYYALHRCSRSNTSGGTFVEVCFLLRHPWQLLTSGFFGT